MWNYKYQSGKKEHEFNFMARDIILDNVDNIESTCEIGAGTGQMSKLIRDKKEVYSTMIDSSQSACNYIREYFIDNGYYFDIKYADIFVHTKDYTADLVMSSGLIEHFKGDKLREIVDIHKKMSNKYVAIIVPNATKENIEFSATEKCKRQYGYQKPISEDELNSMVTDKNWERVYSKVFYKNDKLLIGIYKRKDK